MFIMNSWLCSSKQIELMRRIHCTSIQHVIFCTQMDEWRCCASVGLPWDQIEVCAFASLHLKEPGHQCLVLFTSVYPRYQPESVGWFVKNVLIFRICLDYASNPLDPCQIYIVIIYSNYSNNVKRNSFLNPLFCFNKFQAC